MARYEYECPKCGVFEVTQRMTDDPLTVHTCGEPVIRRISNTAFALKGGGWSADGYGVSKTSCAPGGCEKVGCKAKSEAA
jgi:putative FmdB family regulatory protein